MRRSSFTTCFLPGKMEKHPRHEDLHPSAKQEEVNKVVKEMGWMIPKRAEPEYSRHPSAFCDGRTRSQQR